MVGFWNLSFKEQRHPVLGHLELLDAKIGVLEAFPMVGGDVNEEGTPLSAPKGDSNPAGVEVEVKGRRTGPKESLPDNGELGRNPLPKPGSMGASQRDGDLRRHDRMLAGHAVDECPVAGEPGARTSGGLAGVEEMSEGGVGQESIVGHEAKEGRR